MLCSLCHKAGKKTTDEELEEMLESGNPTIFTSGVSGGGTMHRSFTAVVAMQRRELTWGGV